ISRSSLAAVMSPVMSITRACGEASRTSKVVTASGMSLPSGPVRAPVFDPHEVRQARDLEDLAVVVRESAGGHLDPARAGIREQPDDQRDARAVDVVRAGEVQDDRVRVAGGLLVGARERSLRARIYVADQVEDRLAVVPPDRRRELTGFHRRLLPGAARARGCARLRRLSHAPRRPASRSGTGPIRADAGAPRASPRGPGSPAREDPPRHPGPSPARA